MFFSVLVGEFGIPFILLVMLGLCDWGRPDEGTKNACHEHNSVSHFFCGRPLRKKEGENASSFLSFPHNSRLKNRVKRNSIFSLLSSPHAGRRRHVRWKRRKRRKRRRRNILIGAETSKARHVVQCGFRQRCVKTMRSNTKQFLCYFFHHLD